MSDIEVEEDKIIDVTSDYIFKGIFGDELRAKNFLFNTLVGEGKIFPEGTIIEGIECLETEHVQNKPPTEAKKTVFDLQLTTNQGIFIIEMQKNASSDYLKRVEFYNATAYSQQHIKGSQPSMKDYSQALPIVTISVVTGKMFNDVVPCISYHLNVERKTQVQYMKAFSYVFIELEKFDNDLYDQSNINNDEKDWLLFMKEQNLNHKYDNEQVNSAVEYVQYIKRDKYSEYIRHKMSELAAQKELESAEEMGIEKGKIEGRIEGISIGIEKGRLEGVNIGIEKGKIEIAKKMLSQRKTIEEIIELTELTKEQIEQLK